MYRKLYSMCGYSQEAETSNTHFLDPNDSNYYAPEQFYEIADHIQTVNIKHPQQLKFGKQGISDFPFKFEDESTSANKCKSCSSGARESYIKIPMQGSKHYKSGAKSVVNCTSCYSGEGKNAIPVTSIDTSDVRLVDQVYKDPGSCNNPISTLSHPSDTSDYGWEKSRWNKIKENYEQKEESGLDKKVWGKHGWGLLHAATFGYPENPSLEKQFAMWNFLHSLSCALPCETCVNECDSYVKTNPPPVDNAKKLQKWGWKFHNAVNKRLRKPLFSWEKTKNYYKSKQNMCS